MKQILSTMVLAVTLVTGAGAQSGAVRIRAVEAEIPVNVIESFRRDFKGGEGEEWSILPVKLVQDEYAIPAYNKRTGEKPSFYSVRIKGSEVHREALYDTNGRLLRMKETVKDTALPPEVRDAIEKSNPGYSIVNSGEMIKEGKSTVTCYRVLIMKGKERKIITVDPHGGHLKEKKIV
ncbi:MAG TPA: hypothetical protein VIN08_24570 [Ohtaekwangia sp.]|uniref:hypothetical protein n=1 Tax=Ohtaekwangia sp. TaxID=2066019 RepID=UPI002F92F49C